METPPPYSANLGDAPRRGLRGERGQTARLVDQELGGARQVDLHVNYLSPGSGPGPRHYHEHAENIYFVLDGTIEVELADETRTLTADDVLFIPPGVVHATSNPGPGTARFIEIYAPSGPDFHIVDDEMVG